MKKQKKKQLTEEEKLLSKKIRESKIDEISQWIITQADSLIEDRFTDENLDKEILKRFLLENDDPTQLIKYVYQGKKVYKPKFKMEFYRQIYRLNNWRTDGRKLYDRPGIVGKWTVQIIYSRFPKGVFRILRELNRPLNGVRVYKYFQWLTFVGEEDLKTYIDEAVNLMEISDNWNDFMKKFQNKFSGYYQIGLFDL
ncbi:MAG: P63C domain-containing protein [Ferruginibacter sp.]